MYFFRSEPSKINITANRKPFTVRTMTKNRQAAILLWVLSSFITVRSLQPNRNVVAAFSANRKAFGGQIEIAAFAASSTLDQGKEKAASRTTPTPLPPVIQQIADNRAEFQINLGRAMDTLRRDMPEILSRNPGKGFELQMSNESS